LQYARGKRRRFLIEVEVCCPLVFAFATVKDSHDAVGFGRHVSATARLYTISYPHEVEPKDDCFIVDVV
jgi:hypothetical protein